MLTNQELSYFKTKLELKIKEILERLAVSTDLVLDTNEMSDDADLASVVERQSFTEQMLKRDRELLKEVQDALVRIDSGEYGYCEGSGDEISKNRLELQPWCRYTVPYQEKLERLKKKGGRGITDE
jgi:DnaK suppressor protein